MASRIEGEQHSERSSRGHNQFLHVLVARGFDLTNHRALQIRTVLSEQRDSVVQSLLLFLGEVALPIFELIGVFNLPHKGNIRHNL